MIEIFTITCPKCGYQATEQMPIDACQFFYACKGCGETLKPLDPSFKFVFEGLLNG